MKSLATTSSVSVFVWGERDRVYLSRSWLSITAQCRVQPSQRCVNFGCRARLLWLYRTCITSSSQTSVINLNERSRDQGYYSTSNNEQVPSHRCTYAQQCNDGSIVTDRGGSQLMTAYTFAGFLVGQQPSVGYVDDDTTYCL